MISDGFSSPFCCIFSIRSLSRLDELNFHVELARGFLDLRHEEQIFDKGKDARIGVFSGAGNGSGSGCGYCAGEAGPLASALVAIVVVPPAMRRAIAVVHGRGVDAVFVLAAQAGPGPLSALIVGTASAPPASSSSATGGSSWSCVHSPLKLFATRLQNFTESQRFASLAFPLAARTKAPPRTLVIGSAQLRVATGTHWTLEQTPTLKQTAFANENLLFKRYRFSVYRIRKAPPRNGWRGRPARERGLNENTFIVLVLAQPRKAHPRHFLHRRPCTAGFPELRSAARSQCRKSKSTYHPLETSRAHCCACQ